jgi:hypothetical protein
MDTALHFCAFLSTVTPLTWRFAPRWLLIRLVMIN